jgi:Na+-translocating ferredoxin:NAD+ oxidoreductase RnfD subunit
MHSSPALPSANVIQVISQVIYVLVSGIAAYVWYFGWSVGVNITIATLVALRPSSS